MSQNDRAYSEKRDFIRMRLETPVVLIHEGTRSEALCLDLSSNGMQLESRASLRLGQQVQVQIPSEHNELKGLDAEGEVLRITSLDDGRYSIGLSIRSLG